LRADDTVLVADSERKLEIRPVQVLRAEPETVYISGGLEAGELVIKTIMDAPIPGTQLAISEETSPMNAGAAADAQVASTGEQR